MNNSQPTTGFVYFTNNQSKVETSEYMSFSGTQASPNVNKFSPNCYSSPLKQQWSPKHYNNNRGRSKNNRFSNLSFSPNKSYNNTNSHSNLSYNNSFSSSKHNNSYNRNKNRGDKNLNKNNFLHPSFMEDPWAHLEKQLRQRHSQNNTTNSFVDVQQTENKFVNNSNTEEVSRDFLNP